MKQLQKSDLKVSKIYKLKAHNREYLYRISDMRTSMTLCNDGYLIIDTNHFNKISNISKSHDFADAKYIETKEKYEFYNATPEEKHWLETCISANKFISYEEAMKTFKSEPEFALPEKWCIKNNNPKVSNFFNKILNTNIYIKPLHQNNYLHSLNFNNQSLFEKPTTLSFSRMRPLISFTEITLEQFEKYVLKEKTPKIVAVEKCKSKFIDNNTVETSEGSIFVVGDYVTPFESNSPNKSKKFKITGFRWNNAKTEICAITDLHKPNGIGVDKLELYVETFKLPEKWAIKVNLQNVNIVGKWFNKNSNTGNDDYNKTTVDKSRPVYNILHFPAFNYLGMLKHGDIHSKVEYNYTEITFEQFKKYVLKEEDKPVLTENLTLPKNLCVEVPIPVKKESLLDKAKRLYPVGCKYKEYRGTVYTVNNQTFSQPEKNKIYGENNKGCLFIYDEWAEIIKYPHGFKVGDIIKITTNPVEFSKPEYIDKTYTIIKIEGNQLFLEDSNSVLAKNAVKVK